MGDGGVAVGGENERARVLGRIRSLWQRRVVRDGAWVAGGQFVAALVLLVGTRVTTQFVLPDILGTVSLLIGIVALVRSVTCAPILQAQLRFYPDYAARGEVPLLRRVTGRPLRWILSCLVVAMLVAGAAWSARTGESWFTWVFLAGLLIVEVGRLEEVTFLQAARRQRPIAVFGAAEAIGRIAVMVLLVVWLGPSVPAVLAGYLIGSATIYLAMLGMVRRDAGNPAGAAPSDAEASDRRLLWKYAWALVPVAVVGWVTQLGDRYLLGLVLDTTTVGIYSVTYGLMSQPFLVGIGVIGKTLQPIYFKAVSDGSHDMQRRTFRSWLLATAALGMAGFVAVLLLRNWIAALLLAEEYRSGAALMPWIAAGYWLYCVGNVFESRLYAWKLTGRIFVGNLITAIASVVVTLAFVYKWGVVGVAAACPAYFAIMAVTMATLSRRPIGKSGVAP
jgi:O-antigen/teichoic acid export membrane protein